MNRFCITTYTGRNIDFTDINKCQFSIEDIAHALSLLCRYGGHSKKFYSVAEHRVLVSYGCLPVNALWGCLHDAAEFVCQDIVSPLKYIPEMSGYRDIEKLFQSKIYENFGLFGPEPNDIHEADKIIASIEICKLHGKSRKTKVEFEKLPSGYIPKVLALSPRKAEQLFLDRFNELSSCNA